MNQAQDTTGPDDGVSPYLAARRAWNDHVGRVVASRSMWQAVGLLSLVIALGATGGMVHLAGRSKFVPYVVEVDDAGQVRAAAPAKPAAPNAAVIEAQLEKFVTLSRRVTTDIALQRSAVFGVFAMLTPQAPATAKMKDYLAGSPDKTPFERAKRVTVTTEIKSVLQQTEYSWQVEWTETVYSREGVRQSRTPMVALVQVHLSDPAFASEEALRGNPLGVYVRDFDWNPKQRREVSQ